MKTTSKLFSGWSEVTSGERNEIVFERLHKTYGAYEIRTNHNNTLTKAFSGTCFLIVLFSVVVIITKSIPSSEIEIPDTGNITFTLPPPENSFIPKLPEQPISNAASAMTDNLKPEVIDKNIDKENPIIPLNPFNNKLGTGNPIDTGNGEIFNPIPFGGGKEIEDTTTYWSTAIQEQPKFPGGDAERIRFLRNNLHIPEVIKEIGNIKEKIGIVFTVNKDGSINNVALQQGGCKYFELNEEALRVIKKMPAWEPGRQNGAPVCVRLIMPIKFEVK